MKSPEELTDLFRARGLKVTPQRQAVFRAVHGSQTHPTAESVHAAVVADLPMVSLRTVYQTLNDLTAMGELVHIELGTGSARFDPTLDAHHHLVCDSCGTIVDVAVDDTDRLAPAADLGGFAVQRTEIVFRGQCASCRELAATAPAAHRSQITNQNTKEAHPRHG